MFQAKSSILAFVFEATSGALMTTASAMSLRLDGTLVSASSSAARFRALLVTIEVAAVFFGGSGSGSDVSGVSGSTEPALPRRGETEVLVVVVVAGVLVLLRPRFLVCAIAERVLHGEEPSKQERC